MLRARLLVWWLAVARALPVGNQTASDWAWGWWEPPPYAAGAEAEPPLIVLEGAPLRGAAPSPSPAPSGGLAGAAMGAWARAWAEDERQLQLQLKRNAKEALERIDYWSLQKWVPDIEWTGPSPRPRPSPSPRPRVSLDLTFMKNVDDWTPRMKREYLREQKREQAR